MAVPATGGSLAASLAEDWRRGAYFLIVRWDPLRFEAFGNPSLRSDGPPTEQLAELFRRRGAKALLVDRMEPAEREELERAGLQVQAGFRGPIRAALERYYSAAGSD